MIGFSETFTAWGTEAKGREGRVAVCDDKRRQVFRLIFAVLLSEQKEAHPPGLVTAPAGMGVQYWAGTATGCSPSPSSATRPPDVLH